MYHWAVWIIRCGNTTRAILRCVIGWTNRTESRIKLMDWCQVRSGPRRIILWIWWGMISGLRSLMIIRSRRIVWGTSHLCCQVMKWKLAACPSKKINSSTLHFLSLPNFFPSKMSSSLHNPVKTLPSVSSLKAFTPSMPKNNKLWTSGFLSKMCHLKSQNSTLITKWKPKLNQTKIHTNHSSSWLFRALSISFARFSPLMWMTFTACSTQGIAKMMLKVARSLN